MKLLRFFLIYGLSITFSLIRFPLYLEGNGIYWTDALIAGGLSVIGGMIYEYIEKKHSQKQETEG